MTVVDHLFLLSSVYMFQVYLVSNLKNYFTLSWSYAALRLISFIQIICKVYHALDNYHVFSVFLQRSVNVVSEGERC